MTDVPILFDNPFPETMVRAPYQSYTNRVMGTVLVTAGFMEPKGHGYKGTARRAIFRNGEIKVIRPGNYNIGFDYTKGLGKNVTCMYSGKVHKAGREGGYGYRIHIKLDNPFIWEGKSYVCYQAYAHNSKLLKRVGDRVSQGDTIAIEAGHGKTGPRNYGSHVDLDTYFYLNGEKIHVNFELLAGAVKEEEFVEQIELIKQGAHGEDVRWIEDLLALPSTGRWSPDLKEAIIAYQNAHDLEVDGMAGEETCKSLGMTGYRVRMIRGTIAKKYPVQSSTLVSDVEKFACLINDWLSAKSIEDCDNHWKVELVFPRNNEKEWYFFKEHVAIVQGYEDELDEDDEAGDHSFGDFGDDQDALDAEDRRWITALKECPDNGCSEKTAKGEGLSSYGAIVSHEIAKKDLPRLNGAIVKRFKKIGDKYDIPFSVLIAIASRESHFGAILGKWGNKPGWGDNNHGFGWLQIDKRYHKVKGKQDSASLEHIDQAAAIFAGMRDQLQVKHGWSDSRLLEGACCAYNAGVSNVRTASSKEMNRGTTHDDYGSDVISRAKFFHSFYE